MDVSSQMLTFVKVVEMGSISAASRASGQTPSAISKKVRTLEDHVGHRLLHRTKTGVVVTTEGREIYEKCRAMAEKFHEAEALITTIDGRPRGVLRLASSVAFGKAQLIGALPDFLARYPEISVSLELTDRQVDLDQEGFDAAIHFAEQLTKSDVVTRRIFRNERILCAAPSFIAQHGPPRDFDDLIRFNCLRISNGIGRNVWTAELDGTLHRVDARGNFDGNSADAVFRATLAGLGIARLSTYLVADSLARGDLLRILPAYTQRDADVAVIYADRRNLAPKIRVFVDFLAERFRSPPPAAG